MKTRNDSPARWSSRTIEIKVWKVVAGLIILPILVMWFNVVHQEDEILALVRSDVLTHETGQRTWAGGFVNTNGRTLRDVGVTVDFLDSQNRTVGRTDARANELSFGQRLELQASLPPEAARLRIYSVQWRMDRSGVDKWLRGITEAALMGPFREPWEFGYVMVKPASVSP
jgi:hypothetical protein